MQTYEYQFELKSPEDFIYVAEGILFVTGNFVMLMNKSGTPLYIVPVENLLSVTNNSVSDSEEDSVGTDVPFFQALEDFADEQE